MRTSPFVYETKPATEWILGAPVQKVSPRYAHAALQLALGARLCAWARGVGRVGSEWRFWLAPPGEESRYLVPDLAYLSYERLGREQREAAQEPRVAPDVAVEILSPDDRPGHLAHKVDVYLRAGTAVVVTVDPQTRRLRTHETSGIREWLEGETFTHEALPSFELPLAELFAELDR